MSNLKVAGNASGSGTTTLQSPNTSSSVTLTLPDATAAATLGYLNAPQTSGGTTAYTAVLTDGGKHIYFSGGSTATFTIPTDATIGGSGWPTGTVLVAVNNNSGNLTITGSGVTLQLANGATGTRTVATKGLASLLNVAANTWYVSGAGAS
jgi:hypothetical protein